MGTLKERKLHPQRIDICSKHAYLSSLDNTNVAVGHGDYLDFLYCVMSTDDVS